MAVIFTAIRITACYIVAGFLAAAFVLALGLDRPLALAYGTVMQFAGTALLLALSPARLSGR